jgi:hypothetical protein
MVTTTYNAAILAPAATPARSFATFRTFIEVAGAAIRCAAAVESGYRPEQRDLNALGISDAMSKTRLIGR